MQTERYTTWEYNANGGERGQYVGYTYCWQEYMASRFDSSCED